MSFKEQLKNEILPRTVDYYNSGMDINSSIVKAAQDFKLNLDQTDRLMETMNTARVIAHYEKNAEDRTSNCDIADKDVIRKMLYGDKPQEKSASAGSQAPAWGDYSSYLSAERDYRSAEKLVKAASSEPEKRKSEFTVKQAADHVMDYARRIEQKRIHVEERLGMARDLVATNLSKIAHVLSSGYGPERRYAMFKVACAKSCPEVVKSVDSEISKAIIKDAAPHIREFSRMNVLDTSPVDAVITFARDVEDDISKMAEIQDAVDAFRREEDKVKGVLRGYAEAVKKASSHGPAVSPPSDSGSGSDSSEGGSGEDKKKKDKDKEKKRDPWLDTSSVIGGVTPMAPGAKKMQEYLEGGFLGGDTIMDALAPSKPKHDASLGEYVSNIQRSALISDLYRDDPVLSEADPKEVARAYQNFIQTAPEASLNKEIVRAVLRQSVNSVAVSPFDAKQWMELDKARAEISRMSSGSRA